MFKQQYVISMVNDSENTAATTFFRTVEVVPQWFGRLGCWSGRESDEDPEDTI